MLDLPQHRLLEEQGALCGLHHSHSGPSRTMERLWNLNLNYSQRSQKKTIIHDKKKERYYTSYYTG